MSATTLSDRQQLVKVVLGWTLGVALLVGSPVVSSAQERGDVVVYENQNFGGRSQTLGVGGHILSDFNDIASSIIVPTGLVALLYEHLDAGGGYGISVDLLEDRPDLSRLKFNDKLSYVCVFSRTDPQGYIWSRNSVRNEQFVSGHWERQRAGGTPVNTTAVVSPPLPPHPSGGQPASCAGGPIVRDHRFSMFDLAPFQNAADDNGLLLNPQWGWQLTNPNSLPDPMACHIDVPARTVTTAGKPPTTTTIPAYSKPAPWIAPCCTQRTTSDNSSFCATFGYNGHRNWAPATYEGAIYWDSRSSWPGDDDYNFTLLTPAAGFDTNGKPLGVGLTTSNSTELKLEMSGDETINDFDTPWWVSFRRAVDDVQLAAVLVFTANAVNKPRLQEELEKKRQILSDMIDGKHAIVTGLFGLDCAHDCVSELHPVWAMAIRVKEDPSDETWAIIVRRWGNEGFCSDKQHYLHDLPNNTYTFRLPWSPEASSGQVVQQTFHSRFGQATAHPITFSRNQGVLVSFTLPVPQSGEGERINGELHLRWSGAAGGQPAVVRPRPIVETRDVREPVEGEDEAESRLGELVKTMTPAQRSAFNAKIPPKTISKDGKALRPTGPPRQVTSLPARVLRSAPGQVKSVPDARKGAENQQRLDALRAVYGSNIPGFSPRPPRVPIP